MHADVVWDEKIEKMLEKRSWERKIKEGKKQKKKKRREKNEEEIMKKKQKIIT